MLGKPHRRGRLFLLVDGWLRLTARARESRRACEPIRGVRMRTGFGYGDILYVHIVEGAGSLLPVSGQASSSQSVAGVGLFICALVSFVIRQWQRKKTEPAAHPSLAESGGSGEGRKSAKGTTRTRQQSTEIRE
jgi:hypothetical protein